MKKHSTAKPIPCFKRWSRTNYAVFASLHRQVTIGVLAVGMSILLLTTETAAAQQADTSGVSRVMRIEPVGVTGTRLSPSRSIQSQTPVFDRGTEAAAPFQTLEDALRLSPSIDIRERSGKGVQADISIRGGSPDQTMMLLNGINFTDARTGHQTHSLPIDMDCVSGIELIEGIPGVGAYAGAVNVRTVPLYRNYLRLKAEGGQHGYGYTNLSGALTRDRLVLFAAGSLRRSDGYIHNTDFRNVNGYLRMTYDSPKAGFFDFQAGGQGRRFGSNGFYAAYNPDQFEQTATALGSLRWIKEWGFSESAPTQVTARISTVMNGHAVHRPITTTPTTSERSSGATCSGGEAPLRWVATTSITTFSAPIWANRWPLRAAATSAKPNATWAICGCAIP